MERSLRFLIGHDAQRVKKPQTTTIATGIVICGDDSLFPSSTTTRCSRLSKEAAASVFRNRRNDIWLWITITRQERFAGCCVGGVIPDWGDSETMQSFLEQQSSTFTNTRHETPNEWIDCADDFKGFGGLRNGTDHRVPQRQHRDRRIGELQRPRDGRGWVCAERSRDIEVGRLEGHRRSDSWDALVRKYLDQQYPR